MMADPLLERIERFEYDMKCVVERLFSQNSVIEYKDGLAYINGNPYISLKALMSKNNRDILNMINVYLLDAPK
jgi:hypothetical protein